MSHVSGNKTAIKRTAPSAPLKWLFSNGSLHEHTSTSALDYGCGRGADVCALRERGYYAVGYDPAWQPSKEEISGRTFDVVLCTYVLNVVPESEAAEIVKTVESRVSVDGQAFIAVRRDLPLEGKKGRGCWQRWVPCPLGWRVIYEDKKMAIFGFTREEKS